MAAMSWPNELKALILMQNKQGKVRF